MNHLKKIYNFALIGAGKWGQSYIPILKNYAKSFVIADKDPTALDRIEDPSIIKLADPLDIFKFSIDVVFIATSYDSHYDLILETIKKDIHCFVEKPFVLRYHEAEKIFNLLYKKEFKIKLMVGYILNFNFDVQQLIYYLQDFKKDIEYMKINMSNPSIGEPLHISLLPHLMDLFLFFKKETPIYDMYILYKKGKDLFDRLQVQIDYKDQSRLLFNLEKSFYKSFSIEFKRKNKSNVEYIPLSLWKKEKDSFSFFDYDKKRNIPINWINIDTPIYPYIYTPDYEEQIKNTLKSEDAKDFKEEKKVNKYLEKQILYFLKSIEMDFIPQNYPRIMLPYRYLIFEKLEDLKEKDSYHFKIYPYLQKTILDTAFPKESQYFIEQIHKSSKYFDYNSDLIPSFNFLLGYKEFKVFSEEEKKININRQKQDFLKYYREEKDKRDIHKYFSIED